MKKDTIKFYSIVESLVPEYVKEEFPLVIEFLSQYYKSQENQSAALDIIHNIDKYVQIDNVTDLNLTTTLYYPIESFTTDEIFISSTKDFPKDYGLIKIDNEIIWYEKLISDTVEEIQAEIEVGSTEIVSKNIGSESNWVGKILIVKDGEGNIINSTKIISTGDGWRINLESAPITSDEISGYNSSNLYTCEINGNKLINCSRGFSGVTAYDTDYTTDELYFEETEVESHSFGSEITNLSVIFLTEFLKKIKIQLTPGFEDEEFYDRINESTFIRNIKQFYSSKGSDCSFELLFRALFGEDVNIINPRDFLIESSAAQYNSYRDLVVESLEGDPEELRNLTLIQDEYLSIPQAKGTVAKVEKLQRGDEFYYLVSLDLTKEFNGSSNLGKFSIHPKTKVTNRIKTSNDFIDVDSTVGFPESGELEIRNVLTNQTLIVSYSSKTSTQFLDCVGISQDIEINSIIRLNTYAYGRTRSGIVKINITGVLSSVNIDSYPYYSSTNETINIETLGSNVNDIRSDNWFYNISVRYDIESIKKVNGSDNTYEVRLYDKNILKIGDPISLLYSKGEEINGKVIGSNNKTDYLILVDNDPNKNINTELKYQVRKNISKVDSLNYLELSKYSTNVQNVYVDNQNNIFVNSQSLPNYLNERLLITDRSKVFSGNYNNSEIIKVNSHGFYTGDSIVYNPTDDNNRLDLSKGIYFVKVVDSNNIKISRSLENIFTNNFIKVSGNVLNNVFSLTLFNDSNLTIKKLLPQNIFRQISDPVVDNKINETKPGTTGIFVNGVELLNYKSEDRIFYGQIEKIYPIASGNGYDIINPPYLSIEDNNGSGATGYVSIVGSLSRIDIIDPGFDYIETPNIIIRGGNGKDASASVNLISVDHFSAFNASSGINTTTNIIGFSTYHKFRNFEVVYYDPQNSTKISGLSTNTQYYVSVIDPLKIKLYSKFEDASVGINTVSLVGVGTGRQFFKSLIKKKRIGSIQIVNSGYGYETKKRTTSYTGISTFKNSISIKNHGYSNGELVQYVSTGTSIGGLTSGSTYYVTKINDDEFKLSDINSGTTQKDTLYKTKDYINLTSTGVGATHSFNYEPITIEIVGKSGIGSTYFEPVNLRPIFTGKITSVHIENGGQSYGSEVLNLQKVPTINLLNGKNAQVSPVLKDGKIVDVIIKNGGSEYYSTPELKIVGTGSGALLTPIIENRRLTKVKIISTGGGYSEGTIINVVSAGSESKLQPQIKEWRVNLFERLFQNKQIPPDDGVLYKGRDDKNGLEYTHIYAPRKLRSSILGSKSSNGELIYSPDLNLIFGAETNRLNAQPHSPIIGWAYDGNPIYGPYGYSSINGGAIKQMKSGYELKSISNNRPNYPIGTFVEDYEFTGNGDLDEHNGRFCVTPDFPNGVYAYFCTFDLGLPQVEEPFANYKKPVFPYVIGNTYNSKPINFNFLPTSNLNKFNLNDSSLLRNTNPYGLLNSNTYYDYIKNSNVNKTRVSKIRHVSSGKVDSIGIFTGGNNYAIGDSIILSDKKTKGFVSEINGKTVKRISCSTTSISNVEFVGSDNNFIGFCSTPHNLLSNDLISITSSYDYNISGRITVNQHNLTLSTGINSTSVTGIVTYLNVFGSLDFPKIRENDIYFLGNEQIKILNIDKQKSQLRILRNQNGTTGVSSISAGTGITESPRKFRINFGITTSYNFEYNRELYFDPSVSVGIGTSFGVGITSTLFLNTNNYSNPVSIGTGTTTFLYFRDLKDIQNYTSGGYVDIVNSSNSSFNTTKKKIIGIGDTAIKIDFNTSSLSGSGVTAYLNKWNTKDIPTRSIYLPNHGFKTGDRLTYKSNNGTSIGFSTNGINTFTLTDNSSLYILSLSNDLIGVSTFKVGIGSTGEYIGIETSKTGILYFTSVGTGNTHSFTTNYNNILKTTVSKNVATVETVEYHGMDRNDIVDISVLSGITTTVYIRYNKKHRLVVLNPISFISSNVNTDQDTITLNNHGLRTGDKIIHTSNSPVGGLLDNEIYYVIVIDEDTIRLSEKYYNSIKTDPIYINLTSSSNGTISKINPPVKVVKNSKIYFDLSDTSLSFTRNQQSYPAFILNFYEDSSYLKKYESSSGTKFFNVERFGTVGISSDASIILNTKNIPNNLYYRLEPINKTNNDQENIEIIEDIDIINHNQIILSNSLYNGEYSVVGVSSTSFTYNLNKIPEISSYYYDVSTLSYKIKSSSTLGEISKVDVISSNQTLNILPTIDSIKTLKGNSAILYSEGSNIGKITENDIQITDIGFNYSSDFSIRPTAKFSSLFEIESCSSLESISVISPGKNYSTKPDLILYDTYKNEIIGDVILDYDIQSHKVNILKNTNKLNDYTPKIISINNSNGIGITGISFNQYDKTILVQLANSYSSINDFPFDVNDNVFIENISVGIGSTLRGYNSSEYNYNLFKVVNKHPNIGGIGASITCSVSELLNDGEILGTYDSLNSSGKVINQRDLPSFNIIKKKNSFFENETIESSTGSKGTVEYHDKNRNILKVFTFGEFLTGDKFIGLSSKCTGTIKKIDEFRLNYNVSESCVTNKQWTSERGFLNNNSQRIHDNDYYQYFSYSVQSKVDYEKWNENVSKLTHTSGFKKFSDLIIDSNSNGLGMTKEQSGSDISGIADVYSVVDLNCYPDFDLVRENSIVVNSKYGSNEVSFNSKTIQDYIESIGNRVLTIDDFSSQFNSNPRTDKFSVVDEFNIGDFGYKKYFVSIKDKTLTNYVEVGLISLLYEGSFGYLNQYGFLPTLDYLASYDFSISGQLGQLKVYPYKFDYSNYDVTVLSIGLNENLSGIGSTSIGDIVKISSNYVNVGTSSTSTILTIPTTYRSSKVLVQIGSTDGYVEVNELTIQHDNTNVEIFDYGMLKNTSLDSYSGGDGIGIYSGRISGGNVIVEIQPIVGYGSTLDVNTFALSISNTSLTSIGSSNYSTGQLNSKYVAISSSPTPTATVISTFDVENNGSYYFASVEDTTNNKYQTSELVVVTNSSISNITEFGVVYSSDSIGEFSTDISGSNCRLLFTPNPNINVQVRVSEFVSSPLNEDYVSEKNLGNNSSILFGYGDYLGTNLDVKQSFDLTYKQSPIFQKTFDGSSTTFVDIDSNTIEILSGHFFVTGEEIEYSYTDSDISTSNAIGIATTSIVGVGTTNKLPSTLYIVKVDDKKVRVSASASESLLTIPSVLNITSVGIGTNHVFTSKKQNSKCLISIDNIIQSPIVYSNLTTGLTTSLLKTSEILKVSSIDNLYGGDFIQVGEEIMKIRSVGFGTTNGLLVQRSLLGTTAVNHPISDVVTKVTGNYNIIGNTLHLSEPPYGKIPVLNPNNRPDENDYFGISVGSKFNGRVFLRSGVENSINDTYTKNIIVDDISSNFNGITTQFTLTSSGSSITGISTSNAIILINNVFQTPSKITGTTEQNQYILNENSGITSVSFTSNTTINYNDVNISGIPRGGVILSVGSTSGSGYQPLVSAGGTAIVSAAGTIQSISIGNSGSGYRSGIQTYINVGIATTFANSRIVTSIGKASVSNGNIVSVAITNPGTGYTSSNPPIVVFDSPSSYYNLPLVYSSISSGVGTGAKVNIVVGQGSSVISFDISNYGFGYEIGDVLTVSIGGTTGIPTNTSLPFNEFRLTVDKVYKDSFSSWTIGDLQLIDSIESLIDGSRKSFPIIINGQRTTIRSKKGGIDVQSTLLIFVNNVLQVPGDGYVFNGGSTIEFTEAPKIDDVVKILFYKGTGDVDVQNVDILEPIETGDIIKIESKTLGSNTILNQNDRLVGEIISSDILSTNAYFGNGISTTITNRPVTLCKQTEDRFVNGTYVGKSRVLYEPLIFPTTNIIENVSTSSTVFFVESAKTFFDSGREYIQNNVDNLPQKQIRIISQNSIVAASATAVVSSAGTISSIIINDGGVGYTTSPTVILQNPVGYGLTVGIGSTSLATSTISVGGTVSNIVVTNPGSGYTSSNPPIVIIESPSAVYEDMSNVTYQGDFGIIVGVSTTSVGVATTGIVLDLFVPPSSYVRNSSINVGVATTGTSGIQTGYLFVVTNSNIGNGVTSLNSSGSTVGVGTTFLDNIYSVISVSTATTSVPGIGVTYVSRVVVSVKNYNGLTGLGYSEFFGNYSWGRISGMTRKNPKSFTAYNTGYSGISTSPIVIRTNPLKYIGYSTT